LLPLSTGLEIRISYRNDIVPPGQAVLLLKQYDKLLEQTLFSPEFNSDDYMFLESEFLSITPAKERILPTSLSLLHHFVEDNAAKVPGKTAFEFASGVDLDNLQLKTWSYQQLNEDGNRIAHFLQSKGVNPGKMVAICFDKCPEASIAILGILKVGCAYLAIDPSAPISRKQFILEDSDSKILLCSLSKKLELQDLSGVGIHALDEPGVYQGFPSGPPVLSSEIRSNDTCYCLYTSGTTGTPKGCEITHDNAVQAMLAFQRLFSPHWDEDSRWLQFASFHFDVSVLEQYWSWSVGICVTSCPRDLLFEDLPGTIQKLQITHIDLTPSLARLVHPDEVPSLCRGVFITGGEALKQEILDAWGHHGVIYNGYGPTEATIGCTMLPRMQANDKPSNIGPQFDNVGSYVFRPGTSTPVLRGGIGELCVSGPLVGKGYLNRAELTKE
jgi:amino acid adenylation domain-containing protein